MIDHVGIPVSDFARAKAFYAAIFAPLGYSLMKEVGPEQTGNGSSAAGFGKDGKPAFWIGTNERQVRTHVAVLAGDRAAVRAFHATALAHGAADNGAPGLRPHYHANYYGAFVLDPDGHNIEAVCHAAE